MVCNPSIEGRYLIVHMTGVTSGAMVFCEILVYDQPGELLYFRLKQLSVEENCIGW